MPVKRPERIYNETTTTHTTTKRFNYGKPNGWDKQPKPKEFKLKWHQILKGGLLGEDMEPKDYKRYETWMTNVKVVALTIVTIILLTYSMFKSPFITDSGMSEDNKEDSWMDKGLDYVIGKYDDYNIKPLAPVIFDTITIIPTITKEEVDSIMSKYRKDSTNIADSLLSLE